MELTGSGFSSIPTSSIGVVRCSRSSRAHRVHDTGYRRRPGHGGDRPVPTWPFGARPPTASQPGTAAAEAAGEDGRGLGPTSVSSAGCRRRGGDHAVEQVRPDEEVRRVHEVAEARRRGEQRGEQHRPRREAHDGRRGAWRPAPQAVGDEAEPDQDEHGDDQPRWSGNVVTRTCPRSGLAAGDFTEVSPSGKRITF